MVGVNHKYKAISIILANRVSMKVVESKNEATVRWFTGDEIDNRSIPISLLRSSKEAILYKLDNNPASLVDDKLLCLMNPEIKPKTV